MRYLVVVPYEIRTEKTPEAVKSMEEVKKEFESVYPDLSVQMVVVPSEKSGEKYIR